MITLGIDTSNYTTSCAVFDSVKNTVIQRKKLLPVKEGEKGLRQSDAVFHHTQQLSGLLTDLFKEANVKIDAVGVSDKPRDVVGSYMPCFSVGYNTASAVAAALGVPLYCFSHQKGHILAALFSAGKIELISNPFIAFHISGGTTECLNVTPDKEKIIKEEIIGETKDLNIGQAIDRCGVMLGMPFPCGKHIEELAAGSGKTFKPKVSVKKTDCSMSGLENLCMKMYEKNEAPEDIAKFCLEFAAKTVFKMTEAAIDRCGKLPVVYAGGVMSNLFIRDYLSSSFDAVFSQPEYSCDNAAGTAVLAYLKGQINAC
ncbi:MAG: peptidase M22 [Clostridia bacterium]|nr:peptidase M22 [Clostridia bacterium]